MDKDIEFGEEDSLEAEEEERSKQDPDEFLAQNSFRIVYQTNNFFLPQIRDMIEKKEAINLRPEYQRRLRWSNRQKSKLIESLLLNIPVPPVFFYESDAARYEVMDGQQRLNAIHDFFAGDFALSGLTILTPMNGIRYTKCPPRVKRTLDRASVSAIVLLMESEQVKPDKGSLTLTDIRRLVFDRLNTGGRRLNAQEIRNALNPGPLNRILIQLSRLPSFTSAFGIPPYTEYNEEDYYENPVRQKNSLYASMRDCELILRFFALRDATNIRGSMKSILDRTMEKQVSEQEAQELTTCFEERFDFLFQLFDEEPFLIPVGGRDKVSAALYDSSMVAIDELWSQRSAIENDKAGVVSRLSDAIKDPIDYDLLVGRGNTAEAIRGRIKLMKLILIPS